MGMVVRSNLMAMNANRQLGMNNSSVSKSLEKLSSGFKINRAGDDASGLAISEKMKAQIKGLEQASSNSQDGISLVQTAEGALTEVHDMLNRMTELATKSANGTIQDEVDRDAIQSEVDALLSEIDRIGDSTNFNGISLLDGSLSGTGTSAKSVTADFKLSTAGAAAEAETAATKGAYTSTAITSAPTAENDTVTFQVSVDMGNGTIKTFSSTLTFKKDGDGKLNTLVAEDGETYSATTDAATPTELGNAFMTELNKHAEIKDNFKISNNNGALTFEARQAGKTGVASITGFSEIEGKGGVTTAKTQTIAFADATGAAAVAEDAYKSIDLTKLLVYGPGDAANGTTGMTSKLDDAVFEVNGKKFVFVSPTAGSVDITKLDKNINYITASATTLAAADAASMANLIKQKTGVNATSGTVGGTASIDFKTGGTTGGKASGGLTLQIGDTGDDFNMVTVNVDDMRSKSLGVAGLDVSDANAARNSIQTVKDAINMVSTNRANLGALQNRLEHTINNLDVAAENMTAANSRIRDTDMAKQMMDYTKMNVLTQSAQAMLAQANQQPQSILQLLQ